MTSLRRTVPYLGIEWYMQQAGTAIDGQSCDIVTVKRVIAESPACKAGIREGDVIRSVDGTSPDAENTLTLLIVAKRPGAVVNLELMRANKRIHVKVTLGARDLPVFKFMPIERTQPKRDFSTEPVDTQH